MLLSAALMFLYAKFGKFRHRDRMLDMIGWKGEETVLDVGTGRGLLLIGAAKRLDSGRAVGIDIWNEQDLSGNNIENALKNAEIEGVRSRIEIRNEDARKMSFPDASFDVVLSNLCLHNIPDAEGRRQACKEIARVMRPSAVALISDFKSTKLYKSEFEAIGLSVKRSALSFLIPFHRFECWKSGKQRSGRSFLKWQRRRFFAFLRVLLLHAVVDHHDLVDPVFGFGIVGSFLTVRR